MGPDAPSAMSGCDDRQLVLEADLRGSACAEVEPHLPCRAWSSLHGEVGGENAAVEGGDGGAGAGLDSVIDTACGVLRARVAARCSPSAGVW
jgi:hypothetical protein